MPPLPCEHRFTTRLYLQFIAIVFIINQWRHMCDSNVIVVDIIGLKTRNEKNATDNGPPRVPSRLSPSGFARDLIRHVSVAL